MTKRIHGNGAMKDNSTIEMSPSCYLLESMEDPNSLCASIGAKVLVGADIIPTIFTIVANTILLLAIFKTKSLHTPANTLLAALCFSDLLVGAISQPTFLALVIKTLLYEDPSETLSPFVKMSGIVLNGMSFTTVLYITIDRYVAVCHPFWYQKHVSIKNYCIILALTWVFKILIPVISGSSYMIIYGAITIVSIGIMTFCYLRLYCVIVRKERCVLQLGRIGNEERETMHRNKEERSKANTVLILLAVFLGTYIPASVVIIMIFSPNKEASICILSSKQFVLFIWCIYVYCLSSVINPIVYCIRMKTIKTAAKNLFVQSSSRVSPM